MTTSSSAAPAGPAPDDASLPMPLRGPSFGSYAPDEVAWLLTDLSDVAARRARQRRTEVVA